MGSDVWGARASRRFFSEAHWREPIRWNAAAAEDGQRRRVFCASMADVGERRSELAPLPRLATLPGSPQSINDVAGFDPPPEQTLEPRRPGP